MENSKCSQEGEHIVLVSIVSDIKIIPQKVSHNKYIEDETNKLLEKINIFLSLGEKF